MQGQPSQHRSRSRTGSTDAGAGPRAAPGPASPIDTPASLGGLSLVDRSAPPQRFNTVGGIDGLIGMAVLGWAYDRDFGRRRVKITLFVNDQLVLDTTANGLRRELVGIGGHDGFSGFICPIPPERFSPGASIRVFGDGTELTAAPLTLGPRFLTGSPSRLPMPSRPAGCASAFANRPAPCWTCISMAGRSAVSPPTGCGRN